MKKTFLKYDKALLTVMVQADNPERIKELIDKSLPEGAEAFGMQFCKLKPEYRNEQIYKGLFSYTDKPVYVTNYRHRNNEGKTDEQLAEELIALADSGATLCDVMGDLFDKQPDELAIDEKAIQKQMELIEKLHTCKDIASMNGIPSESNALLQNSLDELKRAESAYQISIRDRGDKPVIPVTPPVKVINTVPVTMRTLTGNRTYTFRTESEIDEFVEEIRKNLKAKLGEDIVIKLS